MEHFRRLLGTLQQAVDFVSSFTTYLFGDEAHPGAEDSGSTKEKRNSSSRHDSEVETTHDGDISPREHLEVFEGPLSTEMAPPSQEIRVTSEAATNGVQATTEAIVEASKLPYKWEGQEESQQKLSESSQLPGGAPEPRPTATVIGSIRQRDQEEPTMTGELQQREPEGTSWTEASQQGVAEEKAATKWSQHWEPDRPSAGSEEELDGAGEPKRDQEKDQEGTVWNEGVQHGPPDRAWIGGSQHGELEEAAKMAEGQQLEDVKEQEGEAEVVEEQLWEPDVVAAKEGIQPSMSGWAETVEDQEEGMLGRGERVRRCPEWEQKGELEEAGRIERSQERKQEETLWNEGAPDQILFVEEEQKGPEGSAWTGGVQHGGLEAEGRMVEAEKEQDEEAEEDHQEEPNIVAVKEEIQEVMLLEDQEEEMPGGEEKVGRSPESEPKGELEEAAAGGTEGDQELEETLRNEGTPDQEQQGGQEEAAWTGGLQHGGLLDEAKMVEGQPLEAEKEQEGEVEAEEKPDMVAAKEGIQPSMPGWAETVEDQVEGMLGRGERVRRSLEWEQKGELEEAGRIEGSQEKKQGETLWNEGAPDQILFVEEEQKGAEGSAWTEGFQDGGLEAEGRMVEAEKEQDKEPEEDQQEEPNMVAVKEEIQEVMLLEDQEEEMPGGEEKVGRSPESEPKGELKEAVARGTEGDQELEETLRNEGTPDQEQQGGLEEAAWTGGLQHGGLLDEAKMVEGQPLEAEKEQEGEVEVVEDQHGEPDMAAAKEGIQPSMLGWAETVEVQEEGMLGGGERVRRSPEWEPKGELEEAGRCERSQEREQEDQILFVGEEQKGPEGSAWTEGFQHCGLEAEARMVEAEKDQNEEAKEDRQEEPNTVAVKEEIQEVMLVEDQEEEMLGGEGKVGRSPEWEPKGELEEAAAGGTEGDQEREMEEALWKEEVQQRASDQAQPETEADEDQQGEPVAKEGILQAVLGGAEAEEDQERVLEGEEQLRGSHQWESKEPVTSENQDVEPQGVAENRKGQQGELAEAEETEGDQQREPEDPVRNGAEAKEGDQEEETGEECLVESDQEEALQRLAEASGLDEGVLEATRDKSQLSEETERRLPEESVGYSASVNMPPLTGPRTFPAEATPLDTSAQKERVLLRRKSSIRRAPSLKRPKLQETNVAETQPQETVAEETPSQPQAPRRPNLRHAGFGPVHPNMMAELQTRLRKPQ